jgi:hypothetical protein
VATSMVAGYFYQEAIQFLDDAVFPHISHICDSERYSWEVIPNKASLGTNPQQNAEELVLVAEDLFRDLFQGANTLPKSIQILLSHARTLLEKKFGESALRELVRV